ncbi:MULTISPECIES: hypothetical protein [Pandoraea]|uniref:Uncharacterized protein n=3 Tax=Pandoraea TaxID=93217 RepID=A0A5E4VL70_9BURK|nr:MULTISPECIES: hypothetical protein [Pandoraea]RRJ24981.1 hypothetical protein EIB05_24380 [Pandoraea apista]RRJ72056.1 hypothetical protein EIL82_24280 [Pandoraea apista]RSC95518.1 hypothetical protein EJB12_25315 [Pandoraea apista]RSD07109.1 hypothetical protein EIZ52_25395 [Pandoraea apista]RSK73706.1 hypothetical protein EJE83_25445 [Pandoraea apista]
MPTEKSKVTSSRIGTQMRGALAAAYKSRGRAIANLYYVYSPKTDQDWVLSGLHQFTYFVLIESNPQIVHANYAPATHELYCGGRVEQLTWTAEVEYRDGHREWQLIVAERDAEEHPIDSQQARVVAATAGGAMHRSVTGADLYRNRIQIHNWIQIIHRLSLYRGYALRDEHIEVCTLLDSKRQILLRDVIRLARGGESDAYIGAALRVAARGGCSNDFDSNPLSQDSVLAAIGKSV